MAFAADVDIRFRAESTAAEVIAGHDLTGKLAVVTGAGGGIGRETARSISRIAPSPSSSPNHAITAA